MSNKSNKDIFDGDNDDMFNFDEARGDESFNFNDDVEYDEDIRDNEFDREIGEKTKETAKTSGVKIIITGVVGIIIFVIMVDILKRCNTDVSLEGINNKKVVEDIKGVEGKTKRVELVEETVIIEENSNDGWILFKQGKDKDIAFTSTSIDSVFTVTECKYYVKPTNNEDTYMVKCVLVGNLSGFLGTYSIDLDYERGRLLRIGDAFKVNVSVGIFNEQRFVDYIMVE